jgi:hypothetical protein
MPEHKQLTKGRKLLFSIVLLIVVVVVIELLPYAVAPLLLGRSFSRSDLRQELAIQHAAATVQQTDDAQAEPAEGYLSEHVLHPYLGYVSTPRTGYNRFGFKADDALEPRSATHVHVCLTGGSVAMGLYPFLRKELAQSMQQVEAFKGKEVRMTVLALGGYKQPQQLMALNYFLALGAEFDMVVNVDGFNEIVLPYSDNLPFGIFPAYPRHWNVFSRKKINTRVQAVFAKQMMVRDRQAAITARYADWHLDISNFALLSWAMLNNGQQMELVKMEDDLKTALDKSETDYQVTGPAVAVSDTTAFFAQQADAWARASTLMAGAATGAGLPYFHFLQPNQYVEGSKKLTDTELNIAYEHGDFAYKTAVIKGYPMLIGKGSGLNGRGVDFHDLTPMFQTEPRTVYSDKCCHFNELGYTLMAQEVTRHILQGKAAKN